MRLELLETRALLTYAYPFGAMPDDTGEYMLGDVAVNVVLIESDPTMAPYDNNSTSDPTNPGHGFPVENWNTSAGATGIDSVAVIKQNITAGLQWWKDTLVNMFPNAPANLLNFKINWTYANSPVHTGYEPIARISNDFSGESLSQTGGNKMQAAKLLKMKRTTFVEKLKRLQIEEPGEAMEAASTMETNEGSVFGGFINASSR